MTRYGQAAENALTGHLTLLGIAHETQYPWGAALTPPRRFRADAAIPARRLLIEVVGGAHIAGRERLYRDVERQRLAALAGWTVLPFTPPEAHDGTAALVIEAWLSQSDRRTP